MKDGNEGAEEGWTETAENREKRQYIEKLEKAEEMYISLGLPRDAEAVRERTKRAPKPDVDRYTTDRAKINHYIHQANQRLETKKTQYQDKGKKILEQMEEGRKREETKIKEEAKMHVEEMRQIKEQVADAKARLDRDLKELEDTMLKDHRNHEQEISQYESTLGKAQELVEKKSRGREEGADEKQQVEAVTMGLKSEDVAQSREAWKIMCLGMGMDPAMAEKFITGSCAFFTGLQKPHIQPEQQTNNTSTWRGKNRSTETEGWEEVGTSADAGPGISEPSYFRDAHLVDDWEDDDLNASEDGKRAEEQGVRGARQRNQDLLQPWSKTEKP